MTAAIAVVVPVHRNRETVADLTRRILAAVPEARIVLVDDACPDGSGVVIDALAAHDGRVLGLHHAENRGQQEAIRTGLRAADAAVYVVLDADLQDPPEAIRSLLDRLGRAEGRVDAVFAGRRGSYETPLRRLAGEIHRRLLAALLGLPADAGGYVVMTRACVQAVLALNGPPQLVAMIGRTGLPTTSLPVVRQRRATGRSTIGTMARLRHAAAALVHVRASSAQRPHTNDAGDPR